MVRSIRVVGLEDFKFVVFITFRLIFWGFLVVTRIQVIGLDFKFVVVFITF